jgi:putative Holliday junction resolvase
MNAERKAGETVLGFDFGTRRIGVALGETVTGSARALMALPARAGTPPWSDIARLIAEWRPARLVVGLPHHLDGREAPLAARARAFAAELGQRSGLPLAFWDEALSTEAARESLAEKRRSGARQGRDNRWRDELNAAAAREILQGWLAENTQSEGP